MRKRDQNEPKILDVDASMQGSLIFKDPVHLRINGSFEGRLDTKGILTIGENAIVRADITGEEIITDGKIIGNIKAHKHLRILSRSHIVGTITTPLLSVESGAFIQGKCEMLTYSDEKGGILNVEELAKYLEVETANILEWAVSGKIPAFKDGEEWRFERLKVDEWITKERGR